VSRDALVADAACVIERLGLRPAVVVGQSLGGLTALSLAARHPELVRGLVLVEASPDGGGPGVEETVAAMGDALHLDRPDEWREALTGFLDSLDREGS
jgi:pimeloyl-ACP methyl ester carboxylesterase